MLVVEVMSEIFSEEHLLSYKEEVGGKNLESKVSLNCLNFIKKISKVYLELSQNTSPLKKSSLLSLIDMSILMMFPRRV